MNYPELVCNSKRDESNCSNKHRIRWNDKGDAKENVKYTLL